MIWKNFLRIQWRLLTILIISKKAYETMPFDMWKYKYFEIFSNILYNEMKYEGSKKFLEIKSMLEKMNSFFFRELQLITFIFNSRFLYELKQISNKLYPFCPVSFLLKFSFLLNKTLGFAFLNVRTPFKSKIEKPHTLLFPDLLFLSYSMKL